MFLHGTAPEFAVREAWRNAMRHGIRIAGVAALTISARALANAPLSLNDGASTIEIAGPDACISAAGAVDRGPHSATGTAARNLTAAAFADYVWEPSRWSWDGVQYFWNPGKYVERPTVTATYVPGHWERYTNGWVWYDGRWDYSSSGSSIPR
jgi:hypothetical protein